MMVGEEGEGEEEEGGEEEDGEEEGIFENLTIHTNVLSSILHIS